MINELRTPQEFIDYYWNELQSDLALKNIQVSKVGFIGYILNVLGFTQYNAKNYYDYLFKESFPITAENRQNLYFHSALYGYIPPLAQAASLVGKFDFVLESLPIKDSDVIRRDIYLNDLVLKVDNNLKYTLLSQYHIVDEGSYYIANIIDKNNKSVSLNFTNAKRTVPIFNFEQVDVIKSSFTLPTYPYGSYYAQLIDIPYHFISDIVVYIDGKEYDVKYVKNFTEGSDEVVFVRYLSHNLVLEFGSGIHGKYVPKQNVEVELSVTQGQLGNISAGDYRPTSGTVSVVDTLSDGSTKSPYTYSSDLFVKIEVDYGEGGEDIISSEDLRSELIKYIRNRENLVSERDFYEIFSKYTYDFELLFKKTHVVDNNIYMHVPFRDQYMIPMYTGNVTIPVEDMTTNTFVPYDNKLVEYNLYPEFSMYDRTAVSPFLYLKDDMLNTWKGYLFYDQYDQYFDNFQVYTTDLNIIPASLQFKFEAPYIKFKFHSFYKISTYTFKLTCDQLDVQSALMTFEDDNNVYYNFPFFIDVIDITVDVYDVYGSHVIRYEADSITPIVDYSEYNTLRRYFPPDRDTQYWLKIDTPKISCIEECIKPSLEDCEDYCNDTTSYLDTTSCMEDCQHFFQIQSPILMQVDPINAQEYYINIPVVDKTQFNDNKIFILNNVGALFTNIIDPGNRMISDELLIKFLQTYKVPQSVVTDITIQEYMFDIQLPLHLKADIYVDNSYVLHNDIDVATEFETLKLDVSNLLLKSYTGTQISFYRTQVVDFIHNWSWVKHVDVTIYDNGNVIIPNADLETISNKTVLDKIDDKFEAVKYEPVYWWWDINNLELVLKYDEL